MSETFNTWLHTTSTLVAKHAVVVVRQIRGLMIETMPANLGFTSFGTGLIRVLVLHDWFCDHTSWDAALPYLTPERFTYVLADLRGYGASREMEGTYTLEEATSDSIALADHLGWT